MPSFPTNKYRNGFRSYFGINNETERLTCLQGGGRVGFSRSTLNLDGVVYVVGSTCVADVERGTRCGGIIQSLLRQFGSPEAVLDASTTALTVVPVFGKRMAMAIRQHRDEAFADHQMHRQRNTRPVLSHIMMRSIHPVYVKYMIPRLCYI